MMKSTGKASPAKFRSRLSRIHESAVTGLALTERWNPKGRNAVIHRQLTKYFRDTILISEMFLEELNRR